MRQSWPVWLVRFVTLALVGLGMALRLRHAVFDPFALWLDECFWANHLIERSVWEPSIRPLGFMACSKLVVNLFGPSEAAFRALPLASGLATAALSPALARALFRSERARLLLIAALCLHPAAIDLAKEFKPYSISLLLHVLLLLLSLRYFRTGRSVHLTHALVLAAPMSLFSQDIVLAYPGFFLTLILRAAKSRSASSLLKVALAGAVALGIVFAQYWFLWRDLTGGGEYWGGKYDVFFLPEPGEKSGYWRWLYDHYLDFVANFPGLRRPHWAPFWGKSQWIPELRAIDSEVWTALHVLGLVTIVLRRLYVHALLLVLPLALMVGFNAIGLWPFGVFRTNLFALAYLLPMAAIGLDARSDPRPRRVSPFALLPCLFVVLPVLLFEPDWHAQKQYMTSMARIGTKLARLERSTRGVAPPIELVADAWECPPLKYYLIHHPDHESHGASRFVFSCETDEESLRSVVERVLAREPHVAFVFAQPKRLVRAKRSWLKRCSVSTQWRSHDAALTRIVCAASDD